MSQKKTFLKLLPNFKFLMNMQHMHSIICLIISNFLRWLPDWGCVPSHWLTDLQNSPNIRWTTPRILMMIASREFLRMRQ